MKSHWFQIFTIGFEMVEPKAFEIHNGGCMQINNNKNATSATKPM